MPPYKSNYCCNCYFWDESKEDKKIGKCRKNPPTILSVPQFYDDLIDSTFNGKFWISVLPETESDDYCGSFANCNR